MSTETEAVVGNWYKSDDGHSFEVIAIDEDDETIEVQYFDGGIEEFEMSTWDEMQVEQIEPPEDWSGPFDDLEKDDLGYSDIDYDQGNLSASYDDLS